MSADFRHRFDQAQEKKAVANACVANGDFRAASFYYKQIPLFLEQYVQLSLKGTAADGSRSKESNEGLTSMLTQKRENTYIPTADEQKEVDGFYASIQSNLALCHLRLGRFEKAREASNVAIVLMEKYGAGLTLEKPGDPNSPIGRAYYRRALAHINLSNFEEARLDLGCIGGEKEAVAAEQLAALRLREAEAAAKEKKLYKNMFAA